MEGSKRKDYLDIAKGIGIILVVVAHAMPRLSYLWIVINSFHMPLFFIISGILYKTKTRYVSYIKRKIVSLYLPYVGCSLISLVPEFIGGYSAKQLIKIFVMLEPAPLLGAAWFIGALFYTLVGYDLIVRLTAKLRYQSIVLSIVAAVFLIIGLNIKMPLVLMNNILEASFFVHCGFMFKKIKFQETTKKLDWLFGLPLLVVLIIAKYNTVSFATNTYNSKVMFIVAAFCGSTAVLLGSELIESYKVFNWLIFLGQNTIGVVIWQFVSFKVVHLVQIAIYGLSIDKIAEYPVIYEYATAPWIVADTIVGIIVSIILYKALTIIGETIWRKGKKVLNQL